MTVREKYEITEVGILSKYACTSIDETGSNARRTKISVLTAPIFSVTVTAYSIVIPSAD